METKDDLTPEEEVETNPTQGSESEDALDLESLFDADESQDDGDEEDKVAKLEKKLENIEKGVRKYFSENGRKAKQESQKTETPSNTDIDDVSELFFAQVPKAEGVQDDLKSIADAKYNGSILKAWRNEKWLQDKADALDNARKEEEVNKSKIDKPSGYTGGSKKFDPSKVNAEDVVNLKPHEKAAWIRLQAEKERSRDE